MTAPNPGPFDRPACDSSVGDRENRRGMRPTTAAALAELWEDDDAGAEAASVVQPEKPLPTSDELCELTGEDSVDQIRELVLREHGLRDASLERLLTPLTSLEVLSLSNNCLRNLTGWPYFANLTTLNVNFNGLSSLEPLAACVSLEKLYAASNKIASVSALASLERLRTLSLYRNRLASLDACLDVLSSSVLLEELDLGANPCSTGAAYRHTLVATLANVTTLDGDTLTDLDRDLAATYMEQAEAEAAEDAMLFGEGNAHDQHDSASAGASRAPTARLGTAGRPGSSGGGKAQILTLDETLHQPEGRALSASMLAHNHALAEHALAEHAGAAERGTITAAAYLMADDDDDDPIDAELRARTEAMALAAEAAEADEWSTGAAIGGGGLMGGGSSSSPQGTSSSGRPGTASNGCNGRPLTSSHRAGLAHNGTAASVLSSRPTTAATRPPTGGGRPGTASRRPGTRGGVSSSRPGTSAGRAATTVREWGGRKSVPTAPSRPPRC